MKLLCLHGALGSESDWDFLKSAAPINDYAQIVPVNLYAFPGKLDVWAKKFCASLSAAEGPYVLLGYSLGARLAMHALIEKPEIFAGSIFVSAHSGLKNDIERKTRKIWDENWSTKLLRESSEVFLEAWNAQGVFENSLPKEGLEKRPKLEIVRAFTDWSLANQENLLPKLKSVQSPMLWVYGQNDPKFRELARNALTNLPQAKGLEIAGGGHRLLCDKPSELAHAILSFLENLFRAKTSS
jgi:2-succinyl-6-hydroxy-2,4-cyclohexadiene-1-carboxylate synthase